MSDWFSTPLGRALRAVMGLAVLAVGTSLVSVFGILAMLTGLVMTVTAMAHTRVRVRL